MCLSHFASHYEMSHMHIYIFQTTCKCITTSNIITFDWYYKSCEVPHNIWSDEWTHSRWKVHLMNFNRLIIQFLMFIISVHALEEWGGGHVLTLSNPEKSTDDYYSSKTRILFCTPSAPNYKMFWLFQNSLLLLCI